MVAISKSQNWQARVVNNERDPLVRDRLRTMLMTCTEWSLLEEGDKILVGLSGGKDSYALYDLLWRVCQRVPFKLEIIGVHLDQAQPGYEPTDFYSWLDEYGAPYEILREDTYSVVKEKTAPGKTYCVVCSRLRRGILYTAAERLGCNKIALGHHRDDSLETFLMNTFFAGKMQAMPAKYRTDDGKFDVIRPLMGTAESDLIDFAAYRKYPIMPCNLCGSQTGLQRQHMKSMLNDLEAKYPDVRKVMMRSLQNVRPTHLLDQNLAKMWEQAGGDDEHRLKGRVHGFEAKAPQLVRSRSLPIHP